MILPFPFEDLPLLATDDGYESAHVSGLATIDYGRDGVWSVKAVEIDLFRSILGESGARSQAARRVKPEAWKWAGQQIEFTLLSDVGWRRRIAEAIDQDMRTRADSRESQSFLRRFTKFLEV